MFLILDSELTSSGKKRKKEKFTHYFYDCIRVKLGKKDWFIFIHYSAALDK